MRIAVISDVHGNRWALEAVLGHIDRRAVEAVLDLGDSLYGPLDPAGTADVLMRRRVPSVRGNEDRAVVEPPRESDPASLRFTRDRLRPEHVKWLRELPPARVAFGDLLCCHGTPARDDEYLLEAVTRAGVVLRSASDLGARLAGVEQPVVLCGHSHVPRVAGLIGGRLIVNPGSVGLPAYTDGAPHPHAMEAGSPHARYAVLEASDAGWRVELAAVPYDWEAAAGAADRNGRPDWAAWIRSGRASPPDIGEAT